MGNRLFLIVSVIITFTFCGCIIRNAFETVPDRALFENKSIGLNQLIETDGYYIGRRFQNYGPLWDTFILYDDGTYGLLNIPEDSLGQEGVRLWSIISNRYMLSENTAWTSGGIVSIKGDTIRIDTYEIYYPFRYVRREYFKVLDRKTLLKIGVRHYGRTNDEIRFSEDNTKYFFVKASDLPSCAVYLKEEKWAWKNKIDYKKYIANH